MKHLLLILISAILFILSCNSNQENTNSVNKTNKFNSPSDTLIPNISITELDTLDKGNTNFLNLFTEYTRDSLSVLSQYGDGIKNTEFEGRPIGQSMRYLFNSNEYTKDYFEFYACLKFRFTNNLVGLIIRTPSDGANALSLYLYNLAQDKLSSKVGLGAQFGDIGVAWKEHATIYNINSNLKIIIQKFNLYHDEKDYSKYISTDSTFIYQKLNDKLILIKSQLDKKDSGSY